jgi:hypothetical protein
MGDILAAKDLEEYLQLNEGTIDKYTSEEKIPGITIGSRLLFEKEKIEVGTNNHLKSFNF